MLLPPWLRSLAYHHRRLLPALLRFGEEGAQERWRVEAVRYVEFCLVHLRSQDAALHQLAVALYSLQVRTSTPSASCSLSNACSLRSAGTLAVCSAVCGPFYSI